MNCFTTRDEVALRDLMAADAVQANRKMRRDATSCNGGKGIGRAGGLVSGKHASQTGADNRAAVLAAIVSRGEVTCDDLAAITGVSVSRSRTHAVALKVDGLVAEGRVRRVQVFRPTDAGRAAVEGGQ